MFNFLSISNLNASKGTLVLLDAVVKLSNQTKDFHVHFVGAPTAEISTASMLLEIERRGVQNLVTYHGKQYGDDKEIRFDEADCFVHPTLDDCFPLVILEAMVHTLPVITTPVGAIPDMVVNKENGIIVPTLDSQALADAMYEVIMDLCKTQLMGEAAERRYKEKFTAEHFENNLLTILQS